MVRRSVVPRSDASWAVAMLCVCGWAWRALRTASVSAAFCAATGAVLLLVLQGIPRADAAAPGEVIVQPEPMSSRARRPLVIAHRGASALMPEHTLAAYRRAIVDGADFIEPDLVLTRDGHLIARHENALGATTDVATAERFASRRTTKVIDGVEVTDWFAEDFTLAELKTLRARERLPMIRPGNTAVTDERIPTLDEIIGLVREMEEEGYEPGIYPELKHPVYFAYEGYYLDGSPVNESLGRRLVERLVALDFIDPARVYIQSFEMESLLELHRDILPSAGLSLPLVQLLGDLGAPKQGQVTAFRQPWDVLYHARAGHALREVYGNLAEVLALTASTTYADLTSPAAVAALATYAAAVGVWKDSVLLRTVNPVRAVPQATLTGAVHPVLSRALAAGLGVHAYTLRPEPPFLARFPDGSVQSLLGEAVQLFSLGVTGVFADHPAATIRGRAIYESLRAPDSTSSQGRR